MSSRTPGSDVIAATPGAFRLRWDVFLSFRGADTRGAITMGLYESLQARGVRVFLDDVGLERGEEIARGLMEGIDDSAAFIVIISENYASSHWCLEELAKICESRRLVLPVFYRVDPSHVRHQTGPFESGFASHQRRFGENKVSKWREALKKVGGLAGWVLTDSEEDNLIRRLVQRVMKELSNTPMGVPEFAVGLDERVERVMNVLQVESNGVKVLGLYGMGGVGKTTLAKALFNALVNRFEHRCFISNVRQVSSKHDGLVSLQSKITQDLFPGERSPKRVLLVLDDVDDVKQLDALIGKREWFCDGSRVIITTRDTQVLPEKHVNELYEVRELYSSEALELFSYHALRKNKPPENFLNLSEKIVSLTGRMPLALEVFGSFLFGKRREEEWVDAVEKLRLIRPHHLQDVLKISYDGLDVEEKCVFLDVACFFVRMGMKRDDVIDVLRGCGFRGEIVITVLVEKCLIKITQENTLWMHDQIRDMGRQIVVDENLVNPGMRSRLWDRAEIMAVLESHKGTRHIQGIVLDFEEERFYKSKAESLFPMKLQWRSSLRNVLGYIKQCLKNEKYLHSQAEKTKEVILHTKSFEPMDNLSQLQINNLKLQGKFLPAGLKWLQWQGCPLERMPLKSWPRELTVLDLKNSKKIETLWGWNFHKVALRNLQNLSMPGGKLPEWFSGQTVSYSKPKNLELKGVLVGVILSINHNNNIPNMKRDDMPTVIDVQANVLKLGKPLFSTVLNISGVPRTDEEHIHLCRFHDYHQLIAFLKDADTFCVSMRNPPFDKGLELRKCGVHLIFEEDDDYDGNEESLDKGLQSVSEKLANFFQTYEGDGPVY